MQHILNKHFLLREGGNKSTESVKLSLGEFKMPSMKEVMKSTTQYQLKDT